MFVGNIDSKVSEKEFHQFMKKICPSLKSSKIIYDSYLGNSKGFGFIQLEDYEDYKKLINLKEGIKFHNKTLIIK